MKQKLSTHVDPMEVLLIVMGNSMKIKYLDVSGIRHGHQKYLMSVEVGLKYYEKNYISDKCISATSCQIVPFPPPEIGLLYQPDSQNNMKLTSGDIIGYLFISMNLSTHSSFRVFCIQPQNSIYFGNSIWWNM